ncbi:MAG: GCN5-related [Desulfovibrionaceae bacterium]|nr:MAG: GCN5-related [Desulfovibrionaceae bacterium]
MDAPALTCLARQSFDSEAFGLDYYRMVTPDHEALARDLASLGALGTPFMADAKLPAQDIEGSKRLQLMGFRKICVQPTFVLSLTGMRATAVGEPQAVVDMPRDELSAHATNFPYSRFGLDPDVTESERRTHQERWLANSMTSPDILVFREQGAFVSFKVREGAVVIDLVSALPSSRGRGSLLLERLKAWAAGQGHSRIEVTTESENIPACLFYQKNGYRLDRATVAFHLRAQTPE